MGPPPVPEADRDFDAQFTAVFPASGAGGTGSGGVTPRGSGKHLNNLFETNYPDPFREQQQQQQNDLGDGPVEMGMGTPAGGGGGGGSGAGTPTKGPVNSLSAGHHPHHRRNVSDTSAFNK